MLAHVGSAVLKLFVVGIRSDGRAGSGLDAVREHDQIADVLRIGPGARHQRLQRSDLEDRAADDRIVCHIRAEVRAEHERFRKTDDRFGQRVDDDLRHVDVCCTQRALVDRAREARADHRVGRKAIELIDARLQRHERVGWLDIQRTVGRAGKVDIGRIRKHALQRLEERGCRRRSARAGVAPPGLPLPLAGFVGPDFSLPPPPQPASTSAVTMSEVAVCFFCPH